MNDSQLALIKRAAAERNDSISTYVVAAVTAYDQKQFDLARLLKRDQKAIVDSPSGRAIAALVQLTQGTSDPEVALSALLEALGLPDTADAATIEAAVQSLLAKVAAPPPSPDGSDPLASPSDPTPQTFPAKLSAQHYVGIVRAKAHKDLQGGKIVTLSDGRKVKISAAEIEACAQRNMSQEDFALRKASMASRAGEPHTMGWKFITLADGRKVKISAAEVQACAQRNMSQEDFALRKANAVKRT